MQVLRIIGLALFVTVACGSCLASTSEEEQKRPVVKSEISGTNKDRGSALEGIPNDFFIIYNDKTCSGEVNDTNYSIYANGKVSVTTVMGVSLSKKEEIIFLTQEDLQLIVMSIQNNGFFNLDKSYNNSSVVPPPPGAIKPRLPQITGICGRLSVRMDKKFHDVTLNTSRQKEFEAITQTIRFLVERKRPKLDLNATSLRMKTENTPEKTYTDPTTGMEFVLVPGYCYQMGDNFGNGYKNEKPVHEVCIDSFYLGKYEVTQGEYTKITDSNPSDYKKGDRYPVEKVSWNDTQEFIRTLNSKSGKNFRLPTEAEWEYAAREGGKKVRFGTGKDTIGSEVANFDASDKHKQSYSHSGVYRGETTAAGSFQPNALGLFDMSGNVWEWCNDWYDKDYYDEGVKTNPKGPYSGSDRVIRGGGWRADPRNVRASIRSRTSPGISGGDLGFRLALPVQRP